jgi:hypothetical protein
VSIEDRAWVLLSQGRAAIDLDRWQTLAPAEQDNLVRNLVARQTTWALSGGSLPAGLANGFATYAERPILAEQARRGSLVQQLDYGDAIPDLVTIVTASPSLLTLDERTALDYAFVAFLIDHYGLSVFRDLILDSPGSSSWEQPLSATTRQPINDIAVAWERYLPRWFNGDWQVNVLQGFDLSQASALFDRGAYAASIAVAERSEALFAAIDDPVGLAATETLVSRASIGVRTEQLMQEAQTALTQHRYAEAQLALDLAEAQFAFLPAAHTPADLIATWRDMIDRGIAATTDFAAASAASDVWTQTRHARMLADRAANTFATLGDAGHTAEAATLARSLESRLHRMTFIAIALIVLVSLWLLVWLWAWAPSRFVWTEPRLRPRGRLA